MGLSGRLMPVTTRKGIFSSMRTMEGGVVDGYGVRAPLRRLAEAVVH